MAGERQAARLASEAAFHDALAEGAPRPADRFYAVNASSWSYYRRLLLDEAGRAADILEYGSGIGAYSSLALAEAGHRCIGIDISPASVAASAGRMRRLHPAAAVEYRVMDAERLELDRDSFDLVCGNGIIHHLDLERAYGEIARVLRPDGVALFAEPLGHNPLINAYRRLTPDQRTPDEHPLRADDFRLARRFFGGVDVRPFHLLAIAATPLHGTRVFRPLVGVLDAVDDVLFARVPRARRLAWYAVIRLSSPRK